MFRCWLLCHIPERISGGIPGRQIIEHNFNLDGTTKPGGISRIVPNKCKRCGEIIWTEEIC